MGVGPQNFQIDVRADAKRHFDEGERLAAAGRYDAAVAQYRAALRLWEHPAFHYQLALAAWQSEDRATTVKHLRETVRLQPDHDAAHRALTVHLMMDGQIESALEHSAIALSLAPDHEGARVYRASVLVEAGQSHEAWPILRPLLRGAGTPTWAATLYAKIAATLGQGSEAIELNLAVLERTPAGRDKASLHFATAALLDKGGRHDEAFAQARLAHAANPRPYDRDADARLAEGLVQFFTKSRVRSVPRANHGSSRPVFIVGMPRSGTSLVEQILSSHPAIHGAGELHTLQQIATGLNSPPWAAGERFPACLELLSIRQANQLAARYLAETSRGGGGEAATYVTDKFPFNYRDLWLVQILVPDARVIHCVRDPLDTCLSCYMTDFAAGNEYAQELETLGRCYEDYRRLMGHWNEVLDLPILEVRYEAVVEDVEAQARRMLEYLSLPWDERCLRFYENRRHVATASQAQVRRPIYRSSIGRWRRYEGHLGPLIGRLGVDSSDVAGEGCLNRA